MPLQPRLLRTYSRRGGQLRPLPPPDRWISPPRDRKRLFSSTSAGSSAASSARSVASADSDDPDFSLPGKRCREPPGERPARPWRLRSHRRGAAGKENRPPPPPAGELTSPSPSPLPRPRRPAPRRRRRQGPPAAARRPLLCSTPQRPPPAAPPPAQRRRSPPGLAELSSVLLLSPEDGSAELFSPPPGEEDAGRRRQSPAPLAASPLRLALVRGGWNQLPPSPARDDGDGPSCRRVLRASVRGRCQPRGSLPLQRATAAQQAAPPALSSKPQRAVACNGAGSEGPSDDLRRGSRKGSSSQQRGHLTPVVVLDRQEVPACLTGTQLKEQADIQPFCQQPVSPLGLQGVLEKKYKSSKVIPGDGSTCRKACISGFSSSRWGRQTRLRPNRHKNKRQQQANNSFFRPQVRKRGMKKNVLEMSADVRDNDCSFLNNSHCWGRVRASLSFHKKKKVATEESFCNSILCTPSMKSQLSGPQITLSADKAQCCTWSASSMALLAPRNSCSVLEVMLTDAEKVYGECQQEGPISFEECIPLDKMKNCQKIGEGVFGEVFQTHSERGPVALKIIPIEGTERVNGEAQKSFGEILPEIIISKELSLLSEESMNRTVGFISLYSVHCVQGAYPKHLLEAWDKYHKVTGSENDRPDLFGDEQLFMVLEFEFGGSDLENMKKKLNSVASARSILHQVTASLAVAEQELHFEHRDLHWGNVLVKRTDVKELNYVLNGAGHTIPTAGIHVNIIDYTLSRLEKDGLTVFCDLSTDEELFQGTGDYQFDIYRQMKMENSNSWTDYRPRSNVLWLHYLSDKLLKGMVYRKKESTSAMRKIKQQLIKFHKEVLTFGSASEVLHNSSLFQ
ncbi:serine/threonine-protein kinase haspin [Dromaius novaehollandiae]|uniref:serine/threonine-protein kinase haspin n=1 Tax=Dromaius novaehollandiae TaxID=8790 RepID=UPI00311E4EF1